MTALHPPLRRLHAACRVLADVPAVRRLRTRRRRRTLVVGTVTLLALLPGAGLLADRIWPVIALFAPVFAATLLLAGATDFLFDRSPAGLDERQRVVRDTVLDHPYVIGTSLGLAAGMVVQASFAADTAAAAGLAVAVVMGAYLLPTLVLAWRLPDEVDDGAE
ncbi:MAG TPA: hypothetical protein VK906_10845 [Egicoccus sp.]|nr:hypothetical protein [Egicoccus sp.]HSK23667.1 hypothetical protein [Egicoccus sp.]